LNVFVVDAPTIFWILWNALWPFIDPITRAKVHFVNSTKFDQTTGAPLNGFEDKGKFAAVWDMYLQPYNESRYRDLIATGQM
jgi:hypothetical protein